MIVLPESVVQAITQDMGTLVGLLVAILGPLVGPVFMVIGPPIARYGSYVLGLFGFVVMYLAGNKRREAWLFGMGSQVVWVTWACIIGQLGIIPSSILYFVVYFRNWRKWRTV